MTSCIYCGKLLFQPIIKHKNKDYHLDCYMKKDGSKILTRSVLDDITRRLECMSEICANALEDNSSLEERWKKFEEIKSK